MPSSSIVTEYRADAHAISVWPRASTFADMSGYWKAQPPSFNFHMMPLPVVGTELLKIASRGLKGKSVIRTSVSSRGRGGFAQAGGFGGPKRGPSNGDGVVVVVGASSTTPATMGAGPGEGAPGQAGQAGQSHVKPSFRCSQAYLAARSASSVGTSGARPAAASTGSSRGSPALFSRGVQLRAAAAALNASSGEGGCNCRPPSGAEGPAAQDPATRAAAAKAAPSTGGTNAAASSAASAPGAGGGGAASSGACLRPPRSVDEAAAVAASARPRPTPVAAATSAGAGSGQATKASAAKSKAEFRG
mmetsp:Transcript_107602/g.343390  ORF Transcript_107602/g.343390 Transcript_107602/m.343390 type:complete len:304 (+) Transcript_107602:591-1502(+)